MLKQILSTWRNFFSVDSAVKRINEIRNTKRQEGEELELSEFDIELKNVSFHMMTMYRF